MKTRCKKGSMSESGIDVRQRVFTEPSQSASAEDSVRAACRPPSPTCSNRSRNTLRSVRSAASIQLRIKLAEFEAQQRLAEIRRKELQLEAELVSKRLEVQIADIQAEEEEAVSAPKNDAAERVGNWLQNTDVAAELPRNVSDAPPSNAQPTCPAASNEINARTEARGSPPSNAQPTCPAASNEINARTEARGSTPGREIQELVSVLKSMQHARPPPRQACDLPMFTGAAAEWLPFIAAVRDSTTIYNVSAVENIARLRACLRGEAREAVSALLYTATDPQAIIRTLEQYYGRPEMIVDRAMEDIKQLPRPGSSPHELNKLAVKLQNIVCVLQNIDQQDYLRNPMLVREVTEKLSPHLASRWCDYAHDNQDMSEPKIVLLSRFLMREADRTIQHLLPVAASTQGAKRPSKLPIAAISRHRRVPEAVYASDERTKHVCACCGKHHAITKCDALKKMNTDQRWEWAKKSGTCFQCLSGSHRRSECSSKLCGVNKCRRPHHPLLHAERRTARESNEKAARPAPAEAVLSVAADECQASPVLLKVCPVLVSGPRGEIHTYALLDEGSTVTMIDEELAQELGADGPTQPLRLRGVNSTQDRANSKHVQVSIKGMDEPASYVIRARTLNNMSLRNQTVARDVAKYKHLRTLRGRLSYENARPRILIGADNWQLIVTRQLRTGKKSEPAASRTSLGWVVHGKLPRRVLRGGPDEDSVLYVSTWKQHRPETDDLAALVKSHFDIDALGVSSRKKERAEDRRAVEMFEQSARHIDGRYEVGLPWRSDEVAMPRNYDYALKRLRSIERKMDRDPVFRHEYTTRIENLFASGYATRSDGSEATSPKQWFLPHFAVRNPNKPNKIRVVFDAAARAHGTSLNEKLLEGPDLLVSLQGVLLRFRERPVAVTADIQEMFLQIKIKPDDQPAQMFLWRGDERKEPPQQYRMTSMIFGATSSPFLAHSVRNKNAERYAGTHPEAARAITSSHYMDDYVESFASAAEATEVIRDVRHIHSQVSFNLRGWNSNSDEVLASIPPELHARAPNVRLGSRPDHADKTLGLLWDPTRDELGFNTSMARVTEDVRTGKRPPTKREALSAVMSIYDPLGLISHYTISAKILLQNLWREKIGWDEEVPTHSAAAFKEWLDDLDGIARLRLPRCCDVYGRSSRRELHVFNDASEQAYATIAFWRCEQDDGTVTVSLAAAKAKVAPIKPLSIPRLELQAALIGARLAATIKTEQRWSPDRTVYWTDSQTVLQWIQRDARRYTAFVAHRLGEIAELTSPDEWRWLPSEHNVADDATRAGHTNDITAGARWFNGPSFLRNPEDTWPVSKNTTVPDEEVVAIATTEESDAPCLPRIERFSSYMRLLRSTAYVLLFIEKCKRVKSKLEVRHIERAAELWAIQAQHDNFSDEIKRLERGERIKKNSRLYKLDPIIEHGLLRVRGRIDAARAAYDMRRPIILDGRHRLSRLLVEHEHRAAEHANHERVINELRQRYWILHPRPTVRAVARACQYCKIRRAAPAMPTRGNLPPERLADRQRPFTCSAVDYFGPMIVTVGRRREKRWVALFTCLSTRAVHLELVSGLSTDIAIMALRRMAARRGWPRVMYSDNGTNFRGADTELRAAYAEWAPRLQQYGTTKGMEWKFIPPRAPHMGGAWERLVRSVKNALAATLREKTPRDETLHTLLVEAEHSVNSRPLTHVSVDPKDPEALTPNHFLLGTSSSLPIYGPYAEASRATWKQTQALADEFWRRWLVEYLPTLVPRGGADDHGRSLQRGDLVVVVDPTMPRNVWPRGVVEKTYPGPDKKVRAADVRTIGGIFRRPTSKLAVLRTEVEAARREEDVTDVEPALQA